MAYTHTNVQFDEVLTKKAVALLEDRSDFICGQAVPMIGTPATTGNYKIYKNSDFRRNGFEKTAGGAHAKRNHLNLDSKTYSCQEYKSEFAIYDRDRIEGAEVDHAMALMEDGLRTFDLKLASLMTTGVFGADKAGTTDFVKWSDSTSNPVKDIDNYKAEIKGKLGVNPDSLIITRDVFNALKNNAHIIGLLKTTEDKKLTAEKIAYFFELKNVYIMDAVQTSTNMGQTTQTIGFLKTDVALLYLKGSNGKDAPATLKGFYNNATYGEGNQGVIIQTYRDEPASSDIVRGVVDFDIIVQMADGGIFLNDVI